MSAEFALIERYFAQLGNGYPAVVLGIGDDAAVVQPPDGQELTMSTDTLLAGVHFPHAAPPELLAWRALQVNLSDLAAMGAEPLAFTLALSLPAIDDQWLRPFAAGLAACAKNSGIPLVGGDTTSGSLAITITVLGSVPRGQALTRAGARAGDGIYVDGTLGDGAAALHLLTQGSLQDSPALQQRFYQPEVNLPLGVALRSLAHAAIDVSDGLLADLGHVLSASSVGAELQLTALPVSEASRAAASNLAQSQLWSLTGGDDYRLCFTMPPEHEQQLSEQGYELNRIGTVSTEPGIRLYEGAVEKPLPERTGYEHFGHQ